MKNWQLHMGRAASGLRPLVLVVFALVSTLVAHAANVNAICSSATGDCEFAAPGSSSFAPLKKGQSLPIGSTVRTGDDGVAVLVTTPDCAVQLGNNSNLKITELAFSKSGGQVTERKATLTLNSGVVSALVNHDTPKITNFQIQTPQGAAAARGTFYAVYVYNGKTYVGVGEGRIAAMANQ